MAKFEGIFDADLREDLLNAGIDIDGIENWDDLADMLEDLATYGW